MILEPGAKVGDHVRSVASGSKAEFDGVVELVKLTGRGERFYHVRCNRGLLWQRDDSELTLLEAA